MLCGSLCTACTLCCDRCFVETYGVVRRRCSAKFEMTCVLTCVLPFVLTCILTCDLPKIEMTQLWELPTAMEPPCRIDGIVATVAPTKGSSSLLPKPMRSNSPCDFDTRSSDGLTASATTSPKPKTRPATFGTGRANQRSPRLLWMKKYTRPSAARKALSLEQVATRTATSDAVGLTSSKSATEEHAAINDGAAERAETLESPWPRAGIVSLRAELKFHPKPNTSPLSLMHSVWFSPADTCSRQRPPSAHEQKCQKAGAMICNSNSRRPNFSCRNPTCPHPCRATSMKCSAIALQGLGQARSIVCR